MKDLLTLSVILLLGWALLHPAPKADWHGQRAPQDPQQTVEDLPSAWDLKNFTVTPRARYSIQALVLSKHSYWAGLPEDSLAYYDLALGWGPLSDAAVISRLDISQGGRWYQYNWSGEPPVDPGAIITHSANNHIIPADQEVFRTIERIKRYDVVTLEGYLVDVADRKRDWHWSTSLTRADSGGGSCELFWVTSAVIE
ncbi:MAG: hypothetical protein HGA80_06380 [Candidatus Omnitrophica bacterium]|nr:hypothetical protein [Candidatus Omnitrophota bacterium]